MYTSIQVHVKGQANNCFDTCNFILSAGATATVVIPHSTDLAHVSEEIYNQVSPHQEVCVERNSMLLHVISK